MSTPSRRRLMRDFRRLQNDPPQGVTGAPDEDNILMWNAVIFGYVSVCDEFEGLEETEKSNRPDDTPWEGGTFKLTLEFTEEYPNKAPKVKFVSTMFHPNSTLLR